MMFHIAISGGVFLGPLINAYIVQYAGWRWMCGFMAITASATFVVGFFTIHETAYKREIVNLNLPESEYSSKRNWFASLSLTSGYDPQISFWGWLGNTLVLLAYVPDFLRNVFPLGLVLWVEFTQNSRVAHYS